MTQDNVIMGDLDRRNVLLSIGMVVGGLLVSADASAETAEASSLVSDGSHDFDFLFGKWSVKHRQIKADGDVIEFDGESTTRPIQGGLGNLEEATIRHPKKGTYYGTALRLYDPKTKLWSIWWADTNIPSIDKPVVGSFVNGIGTLTAKDPDNPKSMARFLWKNITRTSARWEQAVSEDAGATWRTNWEMDFKRIV